MTEREQGPRPALNLGWIVCPPGLAEAISEEKKRDDRGAPMLEQLAVAQLIESGRVDFSSAQ